MTKKLKKPLSNLQAVCAAALVFALLSFLFFATLYNPSFFIFIILGQAGIIAILVTLRMQLLKKQVEHDLKKEDFIEKINILQAETAQERASIEACRKKILNYSRLKWMVEMLADTFSLEDVVQTLTLELNRFFGARENTVILYLFHPKTRYLGLAAAQRNQTKVDIKAKSGDVYDHWVVKNFKPLLVEDARNDFRFDVNKIEGEEARAVRSLVSVPLMVGEKGVGILRLDSREENVFDSEDLRFLMSIGDQASVTIENALLYERIEELAIRDSLTGLFLRRHFLEIFAQEFSRQARGKKEFSFLMIDLDHFKKYNDAFGHTAGDIVLKVVGKILSEFFLGPGHVVCRYGGEEFAVILPDCPKRKAMEMAEAFRKKIEQQTVVLRRQKTKITASVGVATYPADARIKDELVQQADQALYRAKQAGRNKVCGV